MHTEKNASCTKPRALKKLAGFTLAELIVVVTILAILATVGFLALSGYSQDAKDASIKANLRSVQTAISSESALTGNSPRYYVSHDPTAALTGAVAYVDGNPVALTGGDWNVSGTNYSAGNPNWAYLKLNPDKFKLSSLDSRLAAVFGTADAAYDSKSVSVGAVDASLSATANGKSRSVSYFQVAGIAPSTGVASVAGNFPQPTEAQIASGAVMGLVKASIGTGAIVEVTKMATTNQEQFPIHLIDNERGWSHTTPSGFDGNRIGGTQFRPYMLNSATEFDNSIQWCVTSCKNSGYTYATLHTNCWSGPTGQCISGYPNYDYSYMYCGCSNTVIGSVTSSKYYNTPSSSYGWVYHPMKVK